MDFQPFPLPPVLPLSRLISRPWPGLSLAGRSLIAANCICDFHIEMPKRVSFVSMKSSSSAIEQKRDGRPMLLTASRWRARRHNAIAIGKILPIAREMFLQIRRHPLLKLSGNVEEMRANTDHSLVLSKLLKKPTGGARRFRPCCGTARISCCSMFVRLRIAVTRFFMGVAPAVTVTLLMLLPPPFLSLHTLAA